METISVGAITAGSVITLWGVAQVFAFRYLWFIKPRFAKLSKDKKRTVNMLGLLIVTVFLYGLSLAQVIDAFSPDLTGAIVALSVFFGALGINQGVHKGTKRDSESDSPTRGRVNPD